MVNSDFSRSLAYTEYWNLVIPHENWCPMLGMLETPLYLQSTTLTFLAEQLLSWWLLFWWSFGIDIQQQCTSQPLDWNIQLRLQHDLADPFLKWVWVIMSQGFITSSSCPSILRLRVSRLGLEQLFPWDSDIVMHWVQPSWRTSADYLITLHGCHSSLQEVTARLPEKW